MTVRGLINRLPVYRRNVQYIVRGDQTARDLIREVKDAHREFAADYDCIADKFEGGGTDAVCKRLYKFCEQNLPYQVEPKELQTSRSPGAILTKADQGETCDCKHYAGFIAGILDALNREGYCFDWAYRFASYDEEDSTPEHVFVVVRKGDREIWIDPTPLDIAGFFVSRTYDDRLLVPKSFTDKQLKPESMSIARLSGIKKMGLVLQAFTPYQGTDQEFVSWGNQGLILEDSPAQPIADPPAPTSPIYDPAPVAEAPLPEVVYAPAVVPGRTDTIAVGEQYPTQAPVLTAVPVPDTAAVKKPFPWWLVLVAVGGIYVLSKNKS